MTGQASAKSSKGKKAAPAKRAAGSDSAKAYLDEGEKAFESGDIEAAVVSLSSAHDLNPNSTEAQIALLRAATHSDDRAKAAEIASSIDLSSPDVKLLGLVAKAFRRNRDFRGEGAVWKRVAELRADEATPLVDASEALMRAKDYKGALECAVRASQRDPSAERPRMLRIEALDKSEADPELMGEAIGDLAAVNASVALEHLPALITGGMYEVIANVLSECKKQGARVDPVLLGSLIKTLVNVARRADAEQRFEDAGRFWKSVLDVDAQNATAARGLHSAVNALTRAARQIGEDGAPEEGARLFAVIADLDDQNAKPLQNFASALEKLGRWKEAADVWKRLGEISSGEEKSNAALRIGKCARKVEELDEQLDLINQARQFDASSETVKEWGDRTAAKLIKEVRAQIDAGALQSSVGSMIVIKAWDADQPKFDAVQRRLVSALKSGMKEARNSGDNENAAKTASLLLKIDPDDVGALNLVARQAYEERRFEEAVVLYTRLLEFSPSDEKLYVRLGRLYRSLRSFDKGVPIVTRLLEINPNHPEGKKLLLEMT